MAGRNLDILTFSPKIIGLLMFRREDINIISNNVMPCAPQKKLRIIKPFTWGEGQGATVPCPTQEGIGGEGRGRG
jgi:hypothetical protein